MPSLLPSLLRKDAPQGSSTATSFRNAKTASKSSYQTSASSMDARSIPSGHWMGPGFAGAKAQSYRLQPSYTEGQMRNMDDVVTEAVAEATGKIPTLDEKINFAVALHSVAGVKIGFYKYCSPALNFFDDTKSISPAFIPVVSAETNDFFSKEVEDIPQYLLAQLHRLLSHPGCSSYGVMEPAIIHHFEVSHTLALLEVLPLLVQSYVIIECFHTGVDLADGTESPDSSELQRELLKICAEAGCGAPSTVSVDSTDTDGSADSFMDPRLDVHGTIGKLNLEAPSYHGAAAVERWLCCVPIDGRNLLADPTSEGRAVVWPESKQASAATRPALYIYGAASKTSQASFFPCDVYATTSRAFEYEPKPLNVRDTAFLLRYLNDSATKNDKEAAERRCPAERVHGGMMREMSSFVWGDEIDVRPFEEVYRK